MKTSSLNFLILLLVMSLIGCSRQVSTQSAGDADSLQAVDSLSGQQADGYFSADLKMHGLKGDVKRATSVLYDSDKDGKKGFERDRVWLTSDERGVWTGNEHATFKPAEYQRDNQGRLVSLDYRYVVNKEDDYGYEYHYEYRYDALGALMGSSKSFVGELSGDMDYIYSYNKQGELDGYTEEGNSDDVAVDSNISFTILDRDGVGNWTRRLKKEVCTTTEEWGDGKIEHDTYTVYVLEERTIEYYRR